MSNGESKTETDNVYEVIVLEPKVYRFTAKNITEVEKEMKRRIAKDSRNKEGKTINKVLHSIIRKD